MTTAMQQMIDILSQNPNDFISKEDTLKLLKVVGLPLEQKQICDAYYQGGDDVCPNGYAGDAASQQYYVDTFINQ